MTATPTFAGILRAKIDERLSGVNTTMPGRIESYSALTGLASVQPTVRDPAADAELPVVPNVPVVFLGGGGRRIKCPVMPGDMVLLLVASCSLDRWKASGGGGVGGRPVDPADPRRFDLTDSIALPVSYSGDAIAQIEFTELEEIHAGGSDALALNAALAQLRGWILDAPDGAAFGTELKATLVSNPTWPIGTLVLKGG